MIVIAVIGIIIVLMMPMVKANRERARRLDCANNLRCIATALYRYAAEHNGEFPLNLSDLFPNYVEKVKSFTCPSDIDASEISEYGLDIDTTASYAYASGWSIKDPLDTILLSDKNYIVGKDINHQGEGGNVLYLNGDVTWVNTLDWINPVDKD